MHVALRLLEGIPSLRRHRPVKYIRRCIQLAHKDAFRVVHFSVQSNHIHLIIEAEHRNALSRGVQGLKIRLARRLNALFGRRGAMFSDRYHARAISSPRQARHCLQYVLNNARKHAAEAGRMPARNWIDPFSSAPTFDAWACATVTSDGATEPGITRAAEFWLLRTAWRRYGPLDANVVPGPAG